MKNILDWLFEDNDQILISPNPWMLYGYKKEDLLFIYEKWLSFSLLRELYDLEMTLNMYYFQDRNLVLETYYNYKSICDENWISINYFLDIDQFFEKMKTKHTTQKTKKSKQWYIYIIKSWDYYKIWKTLDLKNRIKRYITENPNEIEVIHSFQVEDYDRQELELHYKFKSKNHNREWFMLDGDDILFLKTL